MLKIPLVALTAVAAGLALAAPAQAETPPIAEGNYTEVITRGDGKILLSPTPFQVAWNCGPDCFQTGARTYRFTPDRGRWQTEPIAAQEKCADGSTRSGSGVWWTADGVNFAGDWLLMDPCPEGLPPSPTSVVSRA